MIIVFIGSERSDCIIKASKYLARTYLHEFSRIYLKYDGELDGWSEHLANFFDCIADEYVMLGMDDFLIADFIDQHIYDEAFALMKADVVCAKLCKSTPEEHIEYPVTTQLCIWNREYLIWLLRQTNSPWNFERRGSQLFDKKCILRTCIDYDCNSSTSFRWAGVKLEGLKKEDTDYIINNLLPLGTTYYTDYGAGMQGELKPTEP